MVQAEGLHDVVARLDVAGTVLHDGARLADAAHEDVEDGVACAACAELRAWSVATPSEMPAFGHPST